MKFEISFPDQPAAEAGVLAQELRLALLRGGVDPNKVEIIKERSDTMDLGSVVTMDLSSVVTIAGAIAGAVAAPIEVAHLTRILYETCRPAPCIRFKMPNGTDIKVRPSHDLLFESVKKIIDAAGSDEHSG
jgi:hypothetical protein